VSPVNSLLEVGAHPCLGSDGYYDLPQQMAIAPLLHNLHQGDPSAFGSGQVIHMVYGNNARLAEQTFGLPFGRLAPGCAADVLVIPYDPATPVNAGNLGGHLLQALNVAPRTVIVAGEVRLDQGQFPGIDPGEVNARARQLAARLWERL
jgi:cytosine/adenosine deaminase-related metal-dependent hydrolase